MTDGKYVVHKQIQFQKLQTTNMDELKTMQYPQEITIQFQDLADLHFQPNHLENQTYHLLSND